MEVAMNLPVRNFTVLSVIEDLNKTQTWLLLRDSQYYCEIETEKVLKTEITYIRFGFITMQIFNSGTVL